MQATSLTVLIVFLLHKEACGVPLSSAEIGSSITVFQQKPPTFVTFMSLLKCASIQWPAVSVHESNFYHLFLEHVVDHVPDVMY